MHVASDTTSESHDPTPTDGRDGRGRFMPGRSGNPVGRKRGSKNKATELRAWMEDGEDGAAVRIVVERALQGDAVAARFLVDRLFPKPRGRPIALDLPETDQALGHAAIYDAALRAMLKAEITPDEAGQVAKLLHDRLQRYGSAAPTAGTTLAAPAQEPPADALQIAAGTGDPPAPVRLDARLDARLLGSTSLKRAGAG